MTFLAPLFLIATLAGIIPVVLHMINRQKARQLPFSTLRFLRKSVEKTRRRQRVHDVLLMIVRILVLVLIALGLAKPTLTNLKSLFGGEAKTAVAIVLDNSASMGLIDQGQLRFRTALSAARQIVDELHDGDQVALFVTGGPSFPEQGRFDRTHEKVLQILAQRLDTPSMTPSMPGGLSYERADLGTKLRQARTLLAESTATNKQIFVLSDMQQLSWETLKEEPGAVETTESAEQQKVSAEQQKVMDIPIIFVDCNRGAKPNVAVQGVELEASVPVAGLPVEATVELFNAAPVAQQRHVELYIDGTRQAGSSALDIPPEGRLKHVFRFAFTGGGLHRGEVRLVGEDGSKLDDRWFFTMEVDQGIPVAVVKPKTHEIPYLEDTFYVERALAPSRSGGSAIRTTMLTASELSGEPLSQYKVVFCVNLPAPDAEAAGRLGDYVAGGGSLVWICGDNVEPEAYNRMNQQAGGRLLVAPLLEVRTSADDRRDSWNIGFLDKQHPALGDLVEPASLYQSVLVYKHVRMDTGGAAGGRVLARLDDGEALLAGRAVEKGKVLMLGTSGHVGWTNLPLRPIFLPLLVRLVFELSGAQQSRHEVLAGSPLVLEFDGEVRPAVVEVQPPSGETIRFRMEERTEKQARPAFSFTDTHQIGVYLLRPLEAARSRQVAFSVNVDPDEADPTKIPRDELEKLFGRTPLVFAEDPEDLGSTFAWLREGESLWELFLAGVLIALVLETFLSNRLSPKY